MTAIRFSFDFISPYAYLGWHLGRRVADRHGVPFEPKPILFAALLDAYGHKGPAEIPPKREYIFKNVLRIAIDSGVELQPPPSHPFRPLLPLRIAGLEMTAEERHRVVEALFTAVWGGGPGAEDEQTVCTVLDRAGLDGADYVRRAGTPTAKDRLRRSTAEALEEGVFGVPTFHVKGELFWGVDSLPHVEKALLGQDPIREEWTKMWRGIPSTASRRGLDS
ncbi:MAG: 2-hydroxychromene-2-carboxylate isomerase [Myxococcota bacterium]